MRVPLQWQCQSYTLIYPSIGRAKGLVTIHEMYLGASLQAPTWRDLNEEAEWCQPGDKPEPTAAWDAEADVPHWDIDDGEGRRRRLTEKGTPVSPDEARGADQGSGDALGTPLLK
jgi:hypothetical protein